MKHERAMGNEWQIVCVDKFARAPFPFPLPALPFSTLPPEQEPYLILAWTCHVRGSLNFAHYFLSQSGLSRTIEGEYAGKEFLKSGSCEPRSKLRS